MIKTTQDLLSTLGEPDNNGVVRFEASGQLTSDMSQLVVLSINDKPVSYTDKKTEPDPSSADLNSFIRNN